MKKYLVILILLSVAVSLLAQITVTNATFPAAGDTLKLAFDNSPEGILAFTPPGGDQVWDFSSLQADVTQNVVFGPADQGSVGGLLPDADLFAVQGPATESYYNVTPDRFELQTYYGVAPYDIVANHLFDYQPLMTERHAPLNFFDLHVLSSGFIELFLPSEFSPLLMINLAAVTNNAQIDSMRYREAISRIDAVDGWGSVSIPGGTYVVLREKRTMYRERRIDAKIPPLGWLDITSNAVQAGFYGLGVDTTVFFYFHNDVAKEPIAIVTLNNQQNAATQVIFKNTSSIVNVHDQTNAKKRLITISPNPALNEATVSFNDIPPGTYRLVLFDRLGRAVIEVNTYASSGNTERLDFSLLSAGTYFFCVFDTNKKVVYREKLVRS